MHAAVAPRARHYAEALENESCTNVSIECTYTHAFRIHIYISQALRFILINADDHKITKKWNYDSLHML
jgi:hypothetical protein